MVMHRDLENERMTDPEFNRCLRMGRSREVMKCELVDALRVHSTDHESIHLFAALLPATIRAAVAQTWGFTSVEEG
jgi:hypothetical protein